MFLQPLLHYEGDTGKLTRFCVFRAVLRIYLICMRIRNRILDLHWKKVDPDSDHELINIALRFF